jgi:hypothetical protein
MGGRLLIANHAEQSNYLTNQQQVFGFVVRKTILKSTMLAKTIMLSQTDMF